jgi:hypothetical protein
MENIKIYRPHSILMNATVKIAKDITPKKTTNGEYWETVNPASRARIVNKNKIINDRIANFQTNTEAKFFSQQDSVIYGPLSIRRKK